MSTPLTSNADVKWAIRRFQALLPIYTQARSYYDGKHPLSFATEKFRSAFGGLFKEFADNLCPTVVETVKDRLKLDGFTVSDAQSDADEIWRRNRLKVRANEVHLDALIEGDAYLIVWPDRDGAPVFYPNRGSCVCVEYDDEQPGYIVRAAKAWPTLEGKYRLTLYFRDRIEKYVTREKVQGGLPDRDTAFVKYEPEGEAWPLENPYGKVPVFHFGNRAGVGSLGISELREAIPVQNALNKSVADMLVAEEFYGYPQRWAIGLEDMDVSEAKQRYQLVAGGVWASDKKEVQFGQFEAADISKFILVSEGFRKEMARVSRTPLHFFALEGTFPSGESLKTAEAPLTAKVNDKSESFGAVWSDALRFSLQILGRGDHQPEAKWLNTETRNEKDEIENVAKKVKELGLPVERGLQELGYTEKQVMEWAPKIAEWLARSAQQAVNGRTPPAREAKPSGEAAGVM
jgi:hypothetical protein